MMGLCIFYILETSHGDLKYTRKLDCQRYFSYVYAVWDNFDPFTPFVHSYGLILQREVQPLEIRSKVDVS